MEITMHINDHTPKQVVGLQNLTEGFWKLLKTGTILRVGPGSIESRVYTHFTENHLGYPETDVVKGLTAPINPGDVTGWLTERFEWIESGSITISW